MAKLCHDEYSKCASAAWMQAWRCLRHGSAWTPQMTADHYRSWNPNPNPNPTLNRSSAVICGVEADLAPLFNAVVNNERSVPLQFTHQLDAAWNQSHPALFSGRLVAPDFVINSIEVRAVQWPEISKFIRVSYIIALFDWRQRMMHRMSG